MITASKCDGCADELHPFLLRKWVQDWSVFNAENTYYYCESCMKKQEELFDVV